MLGAIKQLERVRHIGHVDPQPQRGGPLPEGSRLSLRRPQPGASEPVDSLAEPDVLFPAEALRSGCNVVIKSNGGTHELSLASEMQLQSIIESGSFPGREGGVGLGVRGMRSQPRRRGPDKPASRPEMPQRVSADSVVHQPVTRVLAVNEGARLTRRA
jgi:hypothetical protein